jgi:hypothetical protein
VLVITDHDGFTPEPDGDDGLLVIGSTELSLTAPKSGGPLHLLGIGITGKVEIDRDATLHEAATAVRAMGGLPYLAHPVWSGLRTDEVDGIEACAGIEIFNAGCEVEQGRGHNDAHTGIWISMGHRLGLIATDDSHYPGYDAFRAWVQMHAAETSCEGVLDALASGRFYSTTGPRITGLTFDGEILTVRTTPVRSIAAPGNPRQPAAWRSGHCRSPCAYVLRRTHAHRRRPGVGGDRRWRPADRRAFSDSPRYALSAHRAHRRPRPQGMV